ncbi:TIGR04282 family arsenosugar biosynthesis glycosyltransferase [Marinobacter sp. X15-166B]|uniref:TIGR04282 family arsenosugar biosynthesis glycosyltransferase n=1 Tax=Marinobacter sp. X15-166B TaxID=1897620 RepID=UPI00085C7F51|nr:TIGR04282 family arsenosugar biosynthesis glycosyltransferase [Marinobacter sp. X15-166B]OEY65037.1 hypothetical protein BG841_00150 [Marinobacter sp. X15-166B]
MSETIAAEYSGVLVIQFAKWPEPGRVKTRLMPALGREGALQAHVRLTRAVLGNLTQSPFAVELWWDRALPQPPPAAAPVVADLKRLRVSQGCQHGDGLGARMTNAFERGLANHHKVVIVGSDCPSVDAAYVRAAARALDTHQVVMGPSDDGGYVLLGAAAVADGMLNDIDWGTEAVLTQTARRLDRLGLSYALLEPRWDVDEPEDWRRYLAQSPGRSG